MGRSELERLSREELIELVLRLQRPEKTSRTSSKPPATDRREQQAQSKPSGAKPGHEGYSRAMSDEPETIVELQSGTHPLGTRLTHARAGRTDRELNSPCPRNRGEDRSPVSRPPLGW
jgi:hypothetical protein